MSETAEDTKKEAPLDAKMKEMFISKRVVFLSSQVDDASVATLTKELMYLDWIDSKKPILFVINSPGGSVHSGLGLFDLIKMIKAPVSTLVMGLAASMGSILSLVASRGGKRYCTQHGMIMIHQPLIGGTIYGQATDLEIQAKEIIKTRETLVRIYTQATGKEAAAIEKSLDRDCWMTAKEAKDYGLIDEIIDHFPAEFA